MLYKPEHTGIINHLIAHECGHVLRMYAVPVENRLIPRTDNVVKKMALTGIQSEIDRLSPVLTFERLVQIVNMWSTVRTTESRYHSRLRRIISHPRQAAGLMPYKT